MPAYAKNPTSKENVEVLTKTEAETEHSNIMAYIDSKVTQIQRDIDGMYRGTSTGSASLFGKFNVYRMKRTITQNVPSGGSVMVTATLPTYLIEDFTENGVVNVTALNAQCYFSANVRKAGNVSVNAGDVYYNGTQYVMPLFLINNESSTVSDWIIDLMIHEVLE